MHRSRLGPSVGAPLLLLLILSGCTESLPTDGPVQFDAGNFDQWAFTRADKGDKVVFGALTVTNDGDKPASLDEARLTGPDNEVIADGATIREVRVREIDDGDDLIGAGDWPYEDYADDSVELSGFKLEPDQTAELLFIVTVDQVGHWFWPKTELTYSIGDDKWDAKTTTGFLVCPPDMNRDCDKPEK